MTVRTPTAIFRIGAVEYVNTLPLIDGLGSVERIQWHHCVPSKLIDALMGEEVDVALCSIIDYQKSEQPLVILPVGMLGCCGSTMTVRLFSQTPLKRIEQIYCDTDSHTSVVLLRILLKRIYDISPEFTPFEARKQRTDPAGIPTWPEAILLIGDKVVTDAAPAIRYPYQMDLGAEWYEMTGLPFVFAAWMAKQDHAESSPEHFAALSALLDRQRRHNALRINEIVATHAVRRGWPMDLAQLYLTQLIQYDWDEKAQQGAKRFFQEAAQLHLIPECRPIVTTS